MVDIVRPPLITRYERPRRTISLYTWGDRPTLNLIGQDVIYGDPGQVPGYSQPQPRFINFPWGVHEQVERSLAVAGAGTAPFKQTEWPLPVRSKYRFRYEYPHPRTLAPSGPAPFAQTDWPVPRGPAPKRPRQGQFFASGLALPFMPTTVGSNRIRYGMIAGVGRLMGR